MSLVTKSYKSCPPSLALTEGIKRQVGIRAPSGYYHQGIKGKTRRAEGLRDRLRVWQRGKYKNIKNKDINKMEENKKTKNEKGRPSFSVFQPWFANMLFNDVCAVLSARDTMS